MKNFLELKNIIDAAENDAAKFYKKGNASAETRLRKAMQLIKAKAQDIRYEVTTEKKNKYWMLSLIGNGQAFSFVYLNH